jgi:hypothetical protein
MVARGRFELPSEGPEPSMIDRYTTGLNLLLCYRKVLFPINKLPQFFMRLLLWGLLSCHKSLIDSS